MTDDEYTATNINLPKEINWSLREMALKRKITKKQLILLLLQEAVDNGK